MCNALFRKMTRYVTKCAKIIYIYNFYITYRQIMQIPIDDLSFLSLFQGLNYLNTC